jgi:Na+-driven multidrug efflux pump
VYICDRAGWRLHGVWLAFLLWMILRGLWLTIAFERKHAPSRHRS